MKRPFPELVIAPGEHLGDWKYGDRVLAGQADLEANDRPKIHLKGELREPESSDQEFPQVEEVEQLRGWLWSGHDIVARGVHLETWFPERTIAFARYALVGLNLDTVVDDAYEEATLQATGLDLLFGRAPLKGVRWPPSTAKHLDGEFAASGNPASTQEWHDDEATLTCSYWAQQSSIDNPYRFELRFAPVVQVRAKAPLALDDWVKNWVTPLVRLVALVTRQPQSLSWLELRHQPPRSGDRRWPVRAQVFGSGIKQEPFVSEDADAWRDPRRRPIVDLASAGLELPSLLRSWRELDDSDNPFVELFRIVMFQHDLPRRAQFLYLVQALEALHGYEHRADDARAASSYEARRAESIKRIVARGASAEDVRFLKRTWSKRPREDLAQRLRSLVRHKALPATARAVFDSLAETRLAHDLGEPNVENAVRRIRNDLAHGRRNYNDSELLRWTTVLDALCRAHLLRLLRCPTTVIDAAFRLPDL